MGLQHLDGWKAKLYESQEEDTGPCEICCPTVDCHYCDGDGLARSPHCDMIVLDDPCERCAGDGTIENESGWWCPTCEQGERDAARAGE